MLESLAQASLAPAERLAGERCADATLALGLQQRHGLRARLLVALAELGIDLEASHLFEVRPAKFQAVRAVGPARTYLALRSRLLHAYMALGVQGQHKSADEIEEVRRALARLGQEEALPPAARARALLAIRQQNRVEELRAACQLDPASPWLRARLVGGLLREGQKGAATLELERALECAEALALRERYASLSYQVNGFYVLALHTLQEAGAAERLRALAEELRREVIEARAETRNTRVAQSLRLLQRSVEAALAGEPVRLRRGQR